MLPLFGSIAGRPEDERPAFPTRPGEPTQIGGRSDPCCLHRDGTYLKHAEDRIANGSAVLAGRLSGGQDDTARVTAAPRRPMTQTGGRVRARVPARDGRISRAGGRYGTAFPRDTVYLGTD